MRASPDVQSRMMYKLYEGYSLLIKDDTGDDGLPYLCEKPLHEYDIADNKRHCRELWVRVTIGIEADTPTGWVRAIARISTRDCSRWLA
jgi:hypothetical protein